MKIKIGTRESSLALAQADLIADGLRNAEPCLEIEKVIVKTKGDLILDRPLHEIPDKGLFVKALDDKLLSGEVDIAVHSMKDMPTSLPEKVSMIPVLKREEPRDALITRNGKLLFEELKAGARIGTSSKRRAYQLKIARPDLEIVSLRGNIHTRLEKMCEEDYDGVVLAAAGLYRVGLENRISHLFKIEEIVPAPTQGILCAEFRAEDEIIKNSLLKLCDRETVICANIERMLLSAINGGCHVPFGAYCELSGAEFKLHAVYGDRDGARLTRDHMVGVIDRASEAIMTFARKLMNYVKGE
ncbi:MAG: hydroxymethylbilane synthase [Synergistaceae bacterium]|nr:hydroxymethylbilane synthase [Synergistaceae bacterium]